MCPGLGKLKETKMTTKPLFRNNYILQMFEHKNCYYE